MIPCLSFFISVIVLLSGCGTSTPPAVEIIGSWPDGTAITMLSADAVSGRSLLYGGRTRLPLPPDSSFVIRASHTSMISALSDTIFVENTSESTIAVHLPSPLPRPRHGSWRMGTTLSEPYDSLTVQINDLANALFTTVSAPLDNNSHLRMIAERCHEIPLEVIGASDLDHPSIEELIRLAEFDNIDGLLFNLHDPSVTVDSEALVAILHKRGLTVSIDIELPSGSIPDSLLASMSTLWNDSSDGYPDELRISVMPSQGTVLSSRTIEEVMTRFSRRGIPSSTISFDLSPALYHYRIVPDSLAFAPIKRDELAEIISSYNGAPPSIRLRDGSLRLGDAGSMYVYEDATSIIDKINIFHAGTGIRSGGIHLIDHQNIIGWEHISADDLFLQRQ